VNRGLPGRFKGGLPLTKPPYARIVAMNLNEGTIRWQEPFGDYPAVRGQLEALGVTPPETLGAQGPAGVLVTKGGLIFVGGGDHAFHALDTASGRDLWSAPTLETTGTPMTYATAGGKQFVVVATGRGPDATLVAFSLP
jgi:quinoprotein glucose dehydrogenase